MSCGASRVMLQPSEIPEAIGRSQCGEAPLGVQARKGIIGKG